MGAIKVIWLLFAWDPQAGFYMPIQWFEDEAACRKIEAAEARRGWRSPAPMCGAVADKIIPETQKAPRKTP